MNAIDLAVAIRDAMERIIAADGVTPGFPPTVPGSPNGPVAPPVVPVVPPSGSGSAGTISGHVEHDLTTPGTFSFTPQNAGRVFWVKTPPVKAGTYGCTLNGQLFYAYQPHNLDAGVHYTIAYAEPGYSVRVAIDG